MFIRLAGPQAGWFAKFPNFNYSPNAKVSDEFKRLGAQRHWKFGSRTWRRNWRECWNYEYDRLIGHWAASLATWQQMCAKLGLDDSLGSINKCKKALASVYVSIIDLLECWETAEKPRIFRNKKELSKYTKAGKMFHRDIAKQDKVLRVLLKRLV
ncbi:hypothetical protein N7481_000134 [Penicillium waksmanii]|uniref:uncharacterized protein n=1 Tax=Penicillium waksmanii TaxID=69791 RepID=UPI0025497908|nr:uncharacterized protein N7481_000134 [Penicillium waksmanii]KAJ5999725.1 hypothetical protein N7481_000134 [Penicillium waksmanii]